ncbi:MAG TPA: hypothetical protein DCG49_00410 [Ruminococcus sp.]|nr:hypothetical protein [Ruminococcus sp.]
MKHIKTKIAAIACAAVSAVCGAQGITASAAATHGSTTQSQVEGNCDAVPFFMHYISLKFPTNSYWNSGNPNTVTYSYNSGKTTKVTVGKVCDSGFKTTNVYGGPTEGTQLTRSAAFARKLAEELFDTNIFMRSGTGKTFTPRVGDQITYYTGSGSATHTVFITGVNGGVTYADCQDNTGCKISLTNSCSFSNGVFVKNGVGYSVKHVERPVKVGDVNGDSVVDGNDCTTLIKVQLGTFNFSGVNYDMMRAAADVDQDWVFYDQDDFNYIASHYHGGCLDNHGYVKTLW